MKTNTLFENAIFQKFAVNYLEKADNFFLLTSFAFAFLSSVLALKIIIGN